MAVYTNSEQLYGTLKVLFTRIAHADPQVGRTISKSKLNLRMRTVAPVTEVCLNGRQNPLQIIYGPSALRADIEVELPADLLHGILLNEITMRKAYSSGKIKLRGPVWRAFVLDEVFRAGQSIYPGVFREYQQDGSG